MKPTDPTPEQIKAATTEIQKEWTEAERKRRYCDRYRRRQTPGNFITRDYRVVTDDSEGP